MTLQRFLQEWHFLRRDRKRTNADYILWLDLWTRKRIHKLGHNHGIDQEKWFIEEGFGADCDLCRELAEASRSFPDLKEDAGTKPSQK